MWYKKLHNQILIGLLLGILFGLIFTEEQASLFGAVGNLFVEALKMVIAPLILSSIFVGISSLGDIRKLGSMGSQTIIYYISTTSLAVLIGIIVVNIINPGKGEKIEIKPKHYADAIEALKEHNVDLNKIGRNEKVKHIIKDYTVSHLWITNKLDSKSLDELKTKLVHEGKISKDRAESIIQKLEHNGKVIAVIARLNARGMTIEGKEIEKTIKTTKEKTSLGDAFYKLLSNALMNPFQALATGNTIGIIFFALLLGALATTVGDVGKPLIEFMNSFNEIIFKIIDLIIKLTPIGVMALMTQLIAENASNLDKLLENVGSYMLTVIIGILVHALIVLPALLMIFGKMNPLKYFMGMRSALLTAFTTCTSGGTLPLTFKATQENLGLSKRVTDFVLPLGATVNMDGTALYESVAVIFIANFLGFDLTVADQVVIFITASVAAVGAASIPSAGLVTMTIVLSAVNLPASGIVIIMAVDRFLDMFRTACNVEGDSIGAAIITNLQRKEGNVS